ncbi:MAG: glycosyltransferase family 2 protein [Clostridia bacterium]|nr:glycosyltransferase family 2 protein [Clostridia bacterium]
MPELSIIVPCYNESKVVGTCYRETTLVLEELGKSYELIFVDDGSGDDTLRLIREIAANDRHVGLVSFSRNFGKEAALYAGLKAARGEYIAVMDADMQDPPSMLPAMYAVLTAEGYDSAATRRVTRAGEPPIRSFFARQFYKIIRSMSRVDIVDGARDFRMMTRQMVDAVLSLQESHRFSKGIFGWVGFKTKWLEYENTKRAAGETKWSFWKLFKYAVDGIVSFTTLPLRFASIMGFAISFFAFVYLIVVLIRTLTLGIVVPGYASLLVTILLLGGIQLISVGILGEYIARTYMESKHRPLFIVKEQTSPRPDDK